MKAISIRHPWAYLIVTGTKDIENRSWATTHRGHVLVHAAKKIDWKAVRMLNIPESQWHIFRETAGGIVGETEIIDCVTKSNSPWFEGPVGFVLVNSRPLEFRPMKGKLGIFDV